MHSKQNFKSIHFTSITFNYFIIFAFLCLVFTYHSCSDTKILSLEELRIIIQNRLYEGETPFEIVNSLQNEPAFYLAWLKR